MQASDGVQLRERDWWTVLPEVACPTLLLDAGAGVVPAGQMAEMARRLPDALPVIVPGTGHLVHRYAPEAYRAGRRRVAQTATPVTRARMGVTGWSAANASAGWAVASTQCGSHAPGR